MSTYKGKCHCGYHEWEGECHIGPGLDLDISLTDQLVTLNKDEANHILWFVKLTLGLFDSPTR